MFKGFIVLKEPNLRRLIVAGIPADLADWLDYVAIIALLTYQWQQGPMVLALFVVALGLPYIVIGPFTGALVDRFDLKKTMVWCNVGRGLLTAALILAPNPLIVFILVFLRSTVDSAFSPARQSAVQALANKDELEAANGLLYAFNQASKIMGPALGGGMLLFWTSSWIFALNACMSLLAALLLAGITIPAKVKTSAKAPNLLAEALEGLLAFVQNKRLFWGLVLKSLSLFSIFMYDTFIALLAKDFGFSATVYGICIAMAGVGGILGAVWCSGLKFGTKQLTIMAVAIFCTGGINLTLGLISIRQIDLHLILFIGSFLVLGITGAFALIPYRTLLQAETPPEKMGRVSATSEAVSVLVLLTAPFVGGFLANSYAIGMPFVVGGVILLLLGFVGAFMTWGKNGHVD